ncbi:COG3772 Phage-related lysozyme (muraminidase) [uncultured Caudovirales phage]|uniref:Lysozyme n=1 Tax=uncultured Caudovirales phage TaxID=2100421 RepID=A0A6J5PCE3_9CAUD|nr:COG3772 Phage-related lysozyme (muraminidase) [uncultured Caudovirales phage]
MADALDLAFEIATRPNFDCLHDPNPRTALIEPYHDPVGYPTQGYGRLLSRVEWEDLSKYPAITVEQAKADLVVDLKTAQRGTHRLIKADLQPHQWAALYDFTFNAGAGNLQISAFRAQINRGELADVPQQLLRWVYANHVKWPGLVRRRAAEGRMWTEGR